MDKVKLPREVAEAIDRTWAKFEKANKGYYIKHMALVNWQTLVEDAIILDYSILVEFAEHNPITYMTALVNGYEVEETPEDKVKSFYETASTNKSILLQHSAISYDEVELQNGIMRGIEGTLNRLNIKIEGIN